jgi:hypothetical protein
MNDATLKQIAAVKAIVSKGNQSGYRTTSGDPPVQQVEMKTERIGIAYRLLFAHPFVRPESEQNSSHLQIDCDRVVGNRDSMFRHSVIHDLLSKAEDDPKPRRFPLDRGFLRTAHGQSGDEASAGHSLAVARTRYIKGRQALRNKYNYQ